MCQKKINQLPKFLTAYRQRCDVCVKYLDLIMKTACCIATKLFLYQWNNIEPTTAVLQ